MKGEKNFTESQLNAIKSLVDKKVVASKEEQKRIRDEIRDVYKFYYSDFSNKKGYTVADIDNLILTNQITVID
jgi:DNA-binding protein Fis